jgi:solute carrier family 25 iron transporter 28/37
MSRYMAWLPWTWANACHSYEALPPNYGLGHNMVAGAFAGIAEHSVMYPVDLLKTRMQIINPAAGGLYTGLSNAFSTIYRIEGLRTLWRGVTSVIVGAGPAHAVYFGTYEVVKEYAGGNKQDGKHHPYAAGMLRRLAKWEEMLTFAQRCLELQQQLLAMR